MTLMTLTHLAGLGLDDAHDVLDVVHEELGERGGVHDAQHADGHAI